MLNVSMGQVQFSLYQHGSGQSTLIYFMKHSGFINKILHFSIWLIFTMYVSNGMLKHIQI